MIILTILGTLAFLVIFAVIYFISLYNSLVAMRATVKQAMANIDVLLRQRNEEIPKLVATCKEYMGYEQRTLTRVILARSGVEMARQENDLTALSNAETEMRGAMSSLLAVAEEYPELKAQSNFEHLTNRISDLQESISDRREGYNANVTIFNTSIEQFPAILIAKRLGFKRDQLLKFKESELKDHDIAELFAQ